MIAQIVDREFNRAALEFSRRSRAPAEGKFYVDTASATLVLK